MTWPARVSINGVTDAGETASGGLKPDLEGRIFGLEHTRSIFLRPEAVEEWDWANPKVGWGLIVPDEIVDGTLAADKAAGADLPEPLARLLAHRRGVLIRHRPGPAGGTLHRYDRHGTEARVNPTGALGAGPGEIPRFLTLWPGPERIPWSVQYELQAGFAVGRIPLEGEALERYVNAVIAEFDGLGIDPLASVVWSVDHGGKDITGLMRDFIGRPLAAELAGDPELAPGLRNFTDGTTPALTDDLRQCLEETNPAFVMTTSHGMTAPASNTARLQQLLGQLVDARRSRLEPPGVDDAWVPGGAIWYAHACASAGSDGRSAFSDLVEDDWELTAVLDGLERVPPMVSPLPRALLGGTRPIRAFIGQVEPTLDWSLRSPETGQVLTAALSEALYRRLYLGRPVGWAMKSLHRNASQLNAREKTLRRAFARGAEDLAGEYLAVQLAALDWRSVVLLGDPAVSLPFPPQSSGRTALRRSG